jgi:hypothetical protein
MSSTAGVVMITGSVVFLTGAAIAVPLVFTMPDREERLRMIEKRLQAWRLGQPGYAGGALIAALGVGWLAFDSAAPSTVWLEASCALLVIGALAWTWSVYLRATHPRDFAMGQLPGWPFATYVYLTLAGLALLGVGLLMGDWPDWPGWLTLAADVPFVVVYARSGDIPPFVFYLVLGTVGVAVL